MKLAYDRKYTLPDFAPPLVWAAITLLFLYERTYLIQKAGLPHFMACTVIRVGLLMVLCHVHIHILAPLFLSTRRYMLYSMTLVLLVATYLLLQGLYDRYLFGFVIGDPQRQGIWLNLPYNAIATGWYLLLTYLIHDNTMLADRSSDRPHINLIEPIQSDILLIKTGTQWVRLPLNAIRYVQGLKDYSVVYTQTGRHIVKGSIGHVTTWLPAGQFIRVHKSYIVAKEHIRSASTTQVILDGQKIPVGRAYASVVKAYLIAY